MDSPYLFGDFDVAELCLVVFFVFFVGLVFHLRREDRREGYPLENDVTGRREPLGSFFFFPSPKTYLLPHGHGTRVSPNYGRDSRALAARRASPMEGSPIEPTGDASADGVGPGAWAERPNYPDMTLEGHTRIAPLRSAGHHFHVDARDPDPRGMTVIGADGKAAGVVSDVWIDRSEAMIRYLEIEVNAGVDGAPGRHVLAPMNQVVVKGRKRTVVIDAIRADQFGGVPVTAAPDQVTLLEEERIMGYFGGGHLYATRDRQEPWL